ncbi:MAG: hypothetical protein R3E10_10100 [Gemmatimonadota bacterium]
MIQAAAGPTARPASTSSRRVGKDVLEFLVELSVAVQRYSIYPANHPTLAPAADALLTRLAKLLEEDVQLSLGVAHRQLVVDGAATDDHHPILADLAGRLHAQHIGAIQFTLDVERASLVGLLSVLAQGDDDPIGLRAVSAIPAWPGLTLHPVGYQNLTLSDDQQAAGGDQVMQLWLGLAAAAMAGETGAVEGDEIPTPALVAAHLRGEKAQAYDEAVVGYLLQIADRLAEGGADVDPVRHRIRALVEELDRGTLRRILEMGGDPQRRRLIVRQCFRGLGGSASIKLLEAAAATSGQEISTLMMRMLTKLSLHADKGSEAIRPKVTHAVRDSVDELLGEWLPDGTSPQGYVRILDEFSRTAPLDRSTRGRTLKRSASSLIQMAIEVDGYGEMVEQAVDELLLKGSLEQVAPLVEGELKTTAARRIRARLASPKQIDALEQVEHISEEALERLVDLVGAEASAAPLLRLLSETSSRALRRTVFDRLTHMSAAVGRAITPFLEDPRWYVVRNMLELVAALPERPQTLSMLRYVSHEDLRVRRAALPLALQEPGARARALSLALQEDDERMVRMGLLELKQELPAALVPTIIERCVRDDEQSVSLRLLAIRVIAQSRDPAVRDALLELAAGKRTLFGKPRLASLDGSDGEVVRTALSVLVQEWRHDPLVAPLLRAAEKVKDVDVHSILEGAANLLEGVGDASDPADHATGPDPEEGA